MSSDKARKDKNQNIQVFIRVRPFNQKERDTSGVVEVAQNREVIVRLSQQTSLTKKFTFDRAFGPNTSQLHVYQEVVSPLIEEVLAGYNCTVFAYGQTGTGKTHTMVGENSGNETNWQNDPLAGIIPRALSQLFDELRLSNTEHTVRVSYLELYNEELVDLLSSSEDNSKLRIYEDITRKGSNIVNGLEEFTVHNKNEVYKIMAQGQERKKVASTFINSQSSRSHTVFTIVVHMKENSPEGEELVKIGKLNLVDLAGSENISKAGSDNPAKKERARECVNINQSLLTLGRVITALVERHPHIPYRESKLTRILQESLGGRTKTSIIATISPGNKDLEETLNTLEYAHRAKNIQNKPEINQKLTKKAILKEYAEEIDRLKRDLQAARDKSGVYLANETYEQMTLKQEVQNKEIQELLLKKRALEDERHRMEGVFSELNRALQASSQKLTATKSQLENTRAELASTSTMLVQTKQECTEQEYLVTKHAQTESALSALAKELLATADVATTHVACLHDTVDKRKGVEHTNLEVTSTYRQQASRRRDGISASVHDFASNMSLSLCSLHEALDAYTATTAHMHQTNKQQLENLAKIFVDAVDEIKSASSESHDSLVQAIASNSSALRSSVEGHRSAVQTALAAFLQSLVAFLQRVKEVDVQGNVATFVHNWFLGASERVASLRRAHTTFSGHTRCVTEKREASDQKICDNRRAHVARQADKMRASLVEMEDYSRRIEERISQQLIDIETERRETALRIEQWMNEERRALEERLARYAASETQALEQRLARKVMEVDNAKKILEEQMARYRELQQMQLDAANEEMKLIDEELAESHSLRDEYANYVKRYEKEFGEGANAIGVDMEVFSKNVVEVVEHINNEMLRQLEQTREGVEQGVSSVVAADAEICDQFIQKMERALTSVITATRQLVERVISSIEAKTTTSVQALSELGSSTSELMSLGANQLVSHGEVCDAARAQAASLETRLCEELGQLAELEGRYLQQEYRVYSPTGKTPSRTEWRYPRQLAATSPHERILARFRAMRQTSLEDVSNAETTRVSDLESSASEDSSLFAAPFARSASASAIVKCTSETDIAAIRELQDSTKENVSRSSSSLNKPSRLRAPSALKYPLGERNDV